MHWQRSKILQVVWLLLILCAGVSAKTADFSARHLAAHHQTASCDLCLVAHAPAVLAGGVLHRAVIAPKVTWHARWHLVTLVSEPDLNQDASRGPPTY